MRRLLQALALIVIPAAWCPAQDRDIRIETALGLRFDPPRFSAAPGETLRIELVNADAMMHNLLFTLPGKRMAVVNTALAMGAEGTAKEWVPQMPEVLLASPLLQPGAKTTLKLKVPDQPGIYPYVCTFPGHGFIMYGAMYAGVDMPPVEKDLHIPPPPTSPFAAPEAVVLPAVFRTGLPDCGPAAIAVGMPDGLHYAWDAGACRLRYIWRGNFLDNQPHWEHVGTRFSQPLGRIWYRAGAGVPLKFNGSTQEPRVQFRGYDFVEGFPRFRYELDGVAVRELVRPLPGGSGVQRQFEVDSPPHTVTFTADPDSGAAFSSPAGVFQNGVLTLSAQQARSFIIELREQAGHQPIGYWSMNDPTFDNALVPGASGRAAQLAAPKKGKPAAQLVTDIRTDELRAGATLLFWFRPENFKTSDQVILSAEDAGQNRLRVGLNLHSSSGLGLQIDRNAAVAGGLTSGLDSKNTGWIHAAFTFQPQKIGLYLNGTRTSEFSGSPFQLPENAPLVLGSQNGKNPFIGALDEVRIYRRVLSAAEIRQSLERDRAIGADAR